MNDNLYAPISESGWELVQHFYDARPQAILSTGKSLQYLKSLVSNWQASELFPMTDFEVFIRPVKGWESVKGDPILALTYLISEKLITPEMGAAQIRAMIKGESHEQ